MTSLDLPTSDAFCELDAARLAAGIARGEFSALEVVNAHIARIERVNPSLNAVVWQRYDEARDEARAVDRKRGAGEPLRALEGVPITIKECLELAGSPATFGLPSWRSRNAERDEIHVARLRAAGAIVLGKTNVAQCLLFLESNNPLYGRTLHPSDATRSPGGSSGGQAAIIAAGGSALGLGTDIGGSGRVPAAFCGIVGLKATAGRMPDHGRGSTPIGQLAVRSQVSVFARGVGDVALPAVKHDATVEVGIMGSYTCLYNLLGWPAGVVPTTRVRAEEETATPRGDDMRDRTARASEQGSAGLPIAVQVAGRPWREDQVLSVMFALQA